MNVQDLEQAIRRHSYLYYNEPENVVLEDPQYDAMVRELKERAPNSPVHAEIGATPIEGKIWHYKKMYSLDNAMNEAEAHKFCKRVWHPDLVISQKMDGAGVELIYWDGQLHMATTRGDGLWGDEIPHIKHIVPAVIPPKKKIVAIYGEVVISGPAFEALGNDYSSPRNLAAGSLMTKDNPMVLKDRGAQFLAHDMSGSGDYGLRLARLEDLGFVTVPYTVTKGWDGALAAFKTLYGLRDEFYQKYGPSDGVVMRVDNREHADAMGYGNKAPKFAIAWKFPHDEKLVKINRIRWDVSKNGRLTPVAEFDGVFIDGAMITNCTLSNASMVNSHRITPGCKIKIIRSGGVIPKFLEVITEGIRPIPNMVIECPSCDHVGEWDDNKTFLHCPNENCPAQAADYIVEFLDRLEYKGLGDKSAQKLVEAGCKTPADIFRLGVGGIMDYLGFSRHHAIEVWGDLVNLKQVPYERFLHALNIDMLGRRYSKQLAEYITPLEFKALVNFWLTPRDSIGYTVFHKVFGGITADRMWESFLNKVDFIQALYDVGFEVQEKKKRNGGAMKFVITGTLSKPRKEYENMIEEAGHEYQSSLTKDTNFLVIGENTGKNKAAKAEKLGTKIITELGLTNLLGGKDE